LRSQVQLLVGGLLVLLLVSAAGTLIVQRQVTSTQHHLRQVLRPAQVAVAKLGEAYVDQETGALGYQLTKDSAFLQPYYLGRSDAAKLQRTLGSDLAGDPRSRRLLARTEQAAATWLAEAAMPEIQPEQRTPLSRRALLRQALTEKRLFDDLRTALGTLDARVNQLAAVEVVAINDAQAVANWLTITAGLVALVLAFVATLILRNSLARPLTRLVAQVQRVADGDLGHSVDVTGPQELSIVAKSVETMRVRILAQTARAMEMQRQLDLAEEGERIAGGLHDVVIRRLSGTGLILQSAAGRHPAAARAMSGAVDEIDKVIRELRTVIFGLRARRHGGSLRGRVLGLVSEYEPRLGFTPHLQFDGIARVSLTGRAADELVSALREILSDIARDSRASEAEIKIGITDGVLRLHVTHDSEPSAARPEGETSARDSMSGGAQLLGGSCTISRGPDGGTSIDWAVPVNGSGGGKPGGL